MCRNPSGDTQYAYHWPFTPVARPTRWRTFLFFWLIPSIRVSPPIPNPHVLSLHRFLAPLLLRKTEFYNKPDFTIHHKGTLTYIGIELKRKLNSTRFVISVHTSVVSHEKTCKTLDTISHSIHKIRKGILNPTDGGNTGVQWIHTFSGSRLLPFADFLLCERISFSKWEKGKRKTSFVGQQLIA